MTDNLTRLQLLRRAAAGGAFLSLPGVLAACGGSSKSAATTSEGKQTLAKTLSFSNWTLYIDIDTKTKKPGTLWASRSTSASRSGVHRPRPSLNRVP